MESSAIKRPVKSGMAADIERTGARPRNSKSRRPMLRPREFCPRRSGLAKFEICNGSFKQIRHPAQTRAPTSCDEQTALPAHAACQIRPRESSTCRGTLSARSSRVFHADCCTARPAIRCVNDRALDINAGGLQPGPPDVRAQYCCVTDHSPTTLPTVTTNNELHLHAGSPASHLP